METKNYKDFDHLTLMVKRTLAKEIIGYYKLLNWTLESESDNRRYEDIVDLKFARPHFIENKDELQLTQIYLEERINHIRKIEKHKHSLSTSFALCLSVVGLAFLALGILAILNTIHIGLAFGITFTAVGVVPFILCAIFIPKIYKNEINKFNTLHNRLSKELHEICNKAAALTGGEHEQE